MENSATYSFNGVSEHDMDMLFLHAFADDQDFLKLFLEKGNIQMENAAIASIEISKTDSELGGSDLTVIFHDGDNRIGLLIEDKIDAGAMKDQRERYIKRGQLGIEKGDYDVFYDYIICPEKYYQNNKEAKKYSYYVTYEECRKIFAAKKDIGSQIRLQQIDQALEQQSRSNNWTVRESPNRFLKQYIAYKDAHYPMLNLRTKENANGYWTHYATDFHEVHLLHKLYEGYADLTILHTADKVGQTKVVASWLQKHGMPNVHAVITGGSSALRINVPSLDYNRPFEETDPHDLDICFEAIKELTDVANIFEVAARLGYTDENF